MGKRHHEDSYRLRTQRTSEEADADARVRAQMRDHRDNDRGLHRKPGEGVVSKVLRFTDRLGL